MKLNFEDKGRSVWGAHVPAFIKSEFNGRMMSLDLRIDAREPGKVRVDRADLIIWEAIDGGDGFATVEEAKAFASRWANAAKAQGTFHPKLA